MVKQKLYKVPVYAIGKASRALEVSLLMNHAACIEMCKAMILSLENEIAVEDKPGLWGFSYNKSVVASRADTLRHQQRKVNYFYAIVTKTFQYLLTDSGKK